MSPYWMNNSCSPFFGPRGSCTLGNLASYALDISTAKDVIAGVQFAQSNNIRLTIKNTGHDYLGRSAGAGSLGLWMRNLDNIDFFNYSSPFYTGPAVHIGAGVGYADFYPAASAEGYHVGGGSCSTVGITGGFSQGGGHGPLASQYGLGADPVLE
ncbi:8f032bd2-a3c3-4e47-8cb5-2f797df00e18 [Sclerotinia trifoliorum]|uniref:8f032bd2-a3c3-4e47-8cb5-2f797df00e18 n=1 Tax=Sclerotinia trifoliorum TaxID=28548 RepID=A0A8H2ZRA3_9HELO|nr:8f032bd2-a3c3-4e47-8cb5-2f797df00e18 [Sclerotinia trifoliorum]